MKTVKVKIVAEVETEIEVEDDELFEHRMVDIYVHGMGDSGHIHKEDHGADYFTITEI